MSNSATPQQVTPTPHPEVAAWLIERIRVYDQVEADAITLNASLDELGLDSIYVMTLCGDIEDTYGITIDPVFFADFETLGDVAKALGERVADK